MNDKTHLLAEKLYGKEISEEMFIATMNKVADLAKIATMLNCGCMVCEIPSDEYVDILDSFNEEDKVLAAMLMADLAGFSEGLRDC